MTTKPFLKWAGGKSGIMDRITAVLPEGTRLIDPFCGGCSVFMGTDYGSYLMTDVNRDLIGLYRDLQSMGVTFIDRAAQYFTDGFNTADAYYDLRNKFNHDGSLSPVEKSMIFLYLNRHGFNGLCRYNLKGKFNAPFGRYERPYFPFDEMVAFYEKSNSCNVSFYHADYNDVFKLAVAPGDVVYCDPPYVPLSNTADFTAYAGGKFTEDDQIQIAFWTRELSDCGVPVVISNHDTPFTRELYAGAQITKFKVQRNISANGRKREKAPELLALFSPKD